MEKAQKIPFTDFANRKKRNKIHLNHVVTAQHFQYDNFFCEIQHVTKETNIFMWKFKFIAVLCVVAAAVSAEENGWCAPKLCPPGTEPHVGCKDEIVCPNLVS